MLSQDLVRLQRANGGPRLSLFLPLDAGSWSSPRMRRAVQTLLTGAERDLCAHGVPAAEAAALMNRVQHALDPVRPLNGQHRGCAVFADSSLVQRHNLSFPLPLLAVTGDRFSLSPLLPALNVHGTFYVLTLTVERIEVFVGTSVTLRRLGLDGLELAAWTTMPPPHPASPVTVPAKPTGHTSVGGAGLPRRATDEQKSRVLHHYRGVDRALRHILTHQAPLLLAGEQHLQALYRAANTYPHLLEAGIDGPGPVPAPDELHRRAWTLARPRLAQGLATAVHTYHRLRGTDRIIDDTSTAVRAAAEGKVATLLVHRAACGWTATGDEPRVVSVGAPTDLAAQLEGAVADTLDAGGETFVISDADVPDPGLVLAIRK